MDVEQVYQGWMKGGWNVCMDREWRVEGIGGRMAREVGRRSASNSRRTSTQRGMLGCWYVCGLSFLMTFSAIMA